MSKKKTAVSSSVSYEVLVPCRNDKTAVSFAVGDVITVKDFNRKVIENWLEITPPVLRIKK